MYRSVRVEQYLKNIIINTDIINYVLITLSCMSPFQ